jgi:hypothetical protein
MWWVLALVVGIEEIHQAWDCSNGVYYLGHGCTLKISDVPGSLDNGDTMWRVIDGVSHVYDLPWSAAGSVYTITYDDGLATYKNDTIVEVRVDGPCGAPLLTTVVHPAVTDLCSERVIRNGPAYGVSTVTAPHSMFSSAPRALVVMDGTRVDRVYERWTLHLGRAYTGTNTTGWYRSNTSVLGVELVSPSLGLVQTMHTNYRPAAPATACVASDPTVLSTASFFTSASNYFRSPAVAGAYTGYALCHEDHALTRGLSCLEVRSRTVEVSPDTWVIFDGVGGVWAPPDQPGTAVDVGTQAICDDTVSVTVVGRTVYNYGVALYSSPSTVVVCQYGHYGVAAISWVVGWTVELFLIVGNIHSVTRFDLTVATGRHAACTPSIGRVDDDSAIATLCCGEHGAVSGMLNISSGTVTSIATIPGHCTSVDVMVATADDCVEIDSVVYTTVVTTAGVTSLHDLDVFTDLSVSLSTTTVSKAYVELESVSALPQFTTVVAMCTAGMLQVGVTNGTSLIFHERGACQGSLLRGGPLLVVPLNGSYHTIDLSTGVCGYDLSAPEWPLYPFGAPGAERGTGDVVCHAGVWQTKLASNYGSRLGTPRRAWVSRIGAHTVALDTGAVYRYNEIDYAESELVVVPTSGIYNPACDAMCTTEGVSPAYRGASYLNEGVLNYTTTCKVHEVESVAVTPTTDRTCIAADPIDYLRYGLRVGELVYSYGSPFMLDTDNATRGVRPLDPVGSTTVVYRARYNYDATEGAHVSPMTTRETYMYDRVGINTTNVLPRRYLFSPPSPIGQTSVAVGNHRIQLQRSWLGTTALYTPACPYPAMVSLSTGCVVARMCDTSEYETRGVTMHSDRECTARRSCGATAYISSPGTTTTDRVCTRRTVCAGTHYQAIGPTASRNVGCVLRQSSCHPGNGYTHQPDAGPGRIAYTAACAQCASDQTTWYGEFDRLGMHRNKCANTMSVVPSTVTGVTYFNALYHRSNPVLHIKNAVMYCTTFNAAYTVLTPCNATADATATRGLEALAAVPGTHCNDNFYFDGFICLRCVTCANGGYKNLCQSPTETYPAVCAKFTVAKFIGRVTQTLMVEFTIYVVAVLIVIPHMLDKDDGSV